MSDTREARRIADAGEKIGGARKDWRFRAMGLDDLDAMTEEEAVGAVRKDNVWPQPDWAAAVASGMDPKAAALAKVLRDRMAQAPVFRHGDTDAARVRAAFVATVSAVRDLVMACRTVGDVEGVYRAHLAAHGVTAARMLDRAASDGFHSVTKGRTYPHQVVPTDIRKAEAMVAEGFPDKVPAWRKGLETISRRDGTVTVAKSGYVLESGFPSVEAALEWAKARHESRKASAPPKPEEPKRPHLDAVERTGLPARRRGDVSADDFIRTFGFRGVEFGNWLPDGERQQVLNLAYDALFDLAEALDWDHRALSLDGTLAVAFGSRGSGNFAAHYESARKVINMTRLSGAGSLAHEYGHAIDHWSGCVGFEGSAREVRSGTGWYSRPGNRAAHLRSLLNLPSPAGEAWEAATSGLYVRERTRPEAIDLQAEAIGKERARLSEVREQLAKHRERPPERRSAVYMREADAWIAESERRLDLMSSRLERLRDGDPATALGTTATDYARQANLLCGKSGEYWRRPTEMFARAFEAMVFDRLGHLGGRSDYLVHGVEEDRFVGERFKGNPYPTGEERAAMYDLVSAVVGELKPLAERALDAGPQPG